MNFIEEMREGRIIPVYARDSCGNVLTLFSQIYIVLYMCVCAHVA